MEKVTKVVPRSAPTAARPYIYNIPPVAAPVIRVGHVFKGPKLVFDVPKWLVKTLKGCELRVVE